MCKITITRKSGITGGACKMICYINDEEICRISENETSVIELKKGKYKFKCRLTMGNPLSNIYDIDLNNNKFVEISVMQGVWKPKVDFIYKEQLSDISINAEKKNSFKITKNIANYIYIDEGHHQWALTKGLINKKISQVFEYSDLIDFELLEDGTSVTKGGLGRAVAGGLIFGGVGAIVGGVTGGKKAKQICNKLQIKITLNNMSNPVVYINLINGEIKTNGIVYKTTYNSAQEILSVLQLICNENNLSNNIDRNINTSESVADEIKKYKELLDMGAISEEEFAEKKKQLLNL